VRELEHSWTVIDNKTTCLRCGKETKRIHYVAVAISSCKAGDKERLERTKGYFMSEFENDPAFSTLNSKEWEYKEKFFTYPTSDYNVIRVILEWIAEEVGVPANELVTENEKKLFIARIPIQLRLGPSQWAVAHYFHE
jgi:hypothetical protein